MRLRDVSWRVMVLILAHVFEKFTVTVKYVLVFAFALGPNHRIFWQNQIESFLLVASAVDRL